MSEKVEYITIWMATYYPEDVHLWHGPRAAMPRNYYFKNKEELDDFLNKNDNIKFQFRIKSTLAISHEGFLYPFPEKIHFSS